MDCIMDQLSKDLKRIAECTEYSDTLHFRDACFDVRKALLNLEVDKLYSEQTANRLPVLIDIFTALRNQAALVAKDNAKIEALLSSLEADQNCFLSKILLVLNLSIQNLVDNLSENKNINYTEMDRLTLIYRVLQSIFNMTNLSSDLHCQLHSSLIYLFDFQHLRFMLTLHSYDEIPEEVRQYLRKITVVFTAVLYNCLKSDELQQHILAIPLKRHAELWLPLLDHVSLEVSEWSLYILFLALKHEGFSKILLFDEAFQSKAILIREILAKFIDEQFALNNKCDDSLDSPTGLNRILCWEETFLSYSFVSEMIDNFKKDMKLALHYGIESVECSQEQSDRVQKISIFALINLKLSSMKIYRENIYKQEMELFELLVEVLKKLQHLARTRPNSLFGMQYKLEDMEQNENGDKIYPMGYVAIYGFKRNVVGLLGNMLYHNTPAQNYLRDSEGLAALLDCNKIEDQNPFIMQWSILAIRNALEENLENIELVRQLERIRKNTF